VVDSDSEDNFDQIKNAPNVITLEDILGDKDAPTAEDAAMDQDDYHQEFIRQMRMNE
jgi:ATP-dependent RNA helicase DDX46/PRP5